MTAAPGAEHTRPLAGGRMFVRRLRPMLGDCAPSGRMRLDAIARWLQDVAYEDVEDAGLQFAAVWVVRRTRIRVRSFPRFAEAVSVRTFCSGLGRMWAERTTTLQRGDGPPDVEAESIWVHLSPETRRPCPLSPAEFAIYGQVPDRRVSARLAHPRPHPDATRADWGFRATELDLAGHVNNAAYWEPLEAELLAGPEPASADVELEFRSESLPGAHELLADGPWRWIVSPDGTPTASLRVYALDFSGSS